MGVGAECVRADERSRGRAERRIPSGRGRDVQFGVEERRRHRLGHRGGGDECAGIGDFRRHANRRRRKPRAGLESRRSHCVGQQYLRPMRRARRFDQRRRGRFGGRALQPGAEERRRAGVRHRRDQRICLWDPRRAGRGLERSLGDLRWSLACAGAEEWRRHRLGCAVLRRHQRAGRGDQRRDQYRRGRFVQHRAENGRHDRRLGRQHQRPSADSQLRQQRRFANRRRSGPLPRGEHGDAAAFRQFLYSYSLPRSGVYQQPESQCQGRRRSRRALLHLRILAELADAGHLDRRAGRHAARAGGRPFLLGHGQQFVWQGYEFL